MITAERPPVPSGPWLVVGLGRAGVAAAEALAERASVVRGWDAASTAATRGAARRLANIGVDVSLGDRPQLEGVRAVARSPGVPLDTEPLASARRSGLPVIDELELGWRLQCAPIVGVTGTNGKGTVGALLTAALRASGDHPVLTGNWEFGPPLSAAEPDGGPLVCEVSSYQLEAAPCFLPELSVLTNLGHDHLQRHGDRRAYGDVKRRMFIRGERTAPAAVVGTGEGFGKRLAHELRVRGARVSTCVGEAADYRVQESSWELETGRTVLRARGERLAVDSRLPGPHNARNLAVALALTDELGIERGVALAAFASAEPVPGRFEVVDAGQPFSVVVDWAHTPEAYREVLHTARGLASGSLRVLIGSAGGMDRTKRPAMGREAARFADRVMVTSAGRQDAEPPRQAIEHLLAGAGEARELDVVLDRREAIRRLVRDAEPGDVVILLGRGAAASPLREGGPPFDDREVLRAELGALVS